MKETDLTDRSEDPDSSCPSKTSFSLPHSASSRPGASATHPPQGGRHCDRDVATRATEALKWVTTLPEGLVSVTVHDATLTLRGEVQFPSMKTAAEQAVRHLEGVRGVNNLIVISLPARPFTPTTRNRAGCETRDFQWHTVGPKRHH